MSSKLQFRGFMSKFPSQEMDRFNVRLPAGMREAIAERAKINGRSMNAEIVQILDDALSCSDDDLQDDDLHTLREIIQVQADLLERYSEALTQGTEILKAANSKNNKPT